jgi:acyl-CoA oxidase
MPMKYISVNREGEFSVEGDLRVLFSVMLNIRVQLVQHSGGTVAKAILIALRYSAVRRQFRNTHGTKQETKLLDYLT